MKGATIQVFGGQPGLNALVAASCVFLVCGVARAAELPDGMVLWLRADAITNVADGALLAEWPDGSGHGHTAKQTEPARQPRWLADGLSGKPAVAFAGSNALHTAEDCSLPATHSLFAVVFDRTTDEGGHFLWLENSNEKEEAADNLHGPAIGTGGYGKYLRVRNYPHWITLPVSPGTTNVLSAIAHPDGVLGYVNGVAGPRALSNGWSGVFANGRTSGFFTVGRHGGAVPQFFTGRIGELLAYDRALSEDERSAVEAYLAQKWALPFPGVGVFAEGDGPDRVTITTEEMRAVVEPRNGARVRSLRVTPDPVEWVPRSWLGGLFADHMWGQRMPGELMQAPYETEVLGSGPAAAAVKLTRTIAGKFGEDEEPNQLQSNVLLEKTYEVRAGERGIRCRIKLTNNDARGKLPSYWQQHIVYPFGETHPEHTLFLRPSARGVRVASSRGREDYIHDIMAGWTAVLDARRGTGLVFLLDYDALGFLYNALPSYTTEWVAEDTYLPAGKSWECETVVLPFGGFTRLQHASRRMLLDLHVKREGGMLRVTYRVARAVEQVTALRLSGEAYSVLDKVSTPLPETALGTLAVEPAEKTVSLTAPGADPLVFRLTAVSGHGEDSVTESFEVFHVGGHRWGDNITHDMVTPVYVGAAPAKKRVLLRPENLQHRMTTDYFLVEGLMTDRWRLDQLWLTMVPWSNFDRSFYKAGRTGAKIQEFPFDYDKLLGYRTIFLSNVKVSGAGQIGMAMLADYVKAGGALWVLGGHVAYGAAGWERSMLNEALPVETTAKPFDVRPARNTRLRPGPNPERLLLDADLSDEPRCYYYHLVEPKPGAHTVLTVDGDRPFLVVGRYGKGYVVCFTGNPMGEPKPGEVPFWKWNGWSTILRNCYLWSAGGQAALGEP